MKLLETTRRALVGVAIGLVLSVGTSVLVFILWPVAAYPSSASFWGLRLVFLTGAVAGGLLAGLVAGHPVSAVLAALIPAGAISFALGLALAVLYMSTSSPWIDRWLWLIYGCLFLISSGLGGCIPTPLRRFGSSVTRLPLIARLPPRHERD